MHRFQIRDEQFGLALYDAESARDALLEYLADHVRAALRPVVECAEDGAEASVEFRGVRYRAIRTEQRPDGCKTPAAPAR